MDNISLPKRTNINNKVYFSMISRNPTICIRTSRLCLHLRKECNFIRPQWNNTPRKIATGKNSAELVDTNEEIMQMSIHLCILYGHIYTHAISEAKTDLMKCAQAFVVLCFLVISSVIRGFVWLIYPYHTRFLHWQWHNRMTALVPVK